VSKHWKPDKKTVALNPVARPSRIRRDPVPINGNVPAKPRRPSNTRERELYFGIAGVLVFAAAIAAGIFGLSIFTVIRADPAADARAAQFGQCYNAQGPNCVVDGDTFYVAGTRVEIAGIEAPGIADARCPAEHDRGVAAAVELAELLNSGRVTIGGATRDPSGRAVRTVEVKGRDLATIMIDRSLAREAGSSPSWC
jgi:endonuclease YncB( thermonuclease family)